MARFAVLFDACVLYPAPLRDSLMRLASRDLFTAYWTDAIHEEWINALLRDKRYTREQLERVRDLIDLHVPEQKCKVMKASWQALPCQTQMTAMCWRRLLNAKQMPL